MGRGDRKTKRGKIWRGSFGKTRPRKIKKSVKEAKKETKKEETGKEETN